MSCIKGVRRPARLEMDKKNSQLIKYQCRLLKDFIIDALRSTDSERSVKMVNLTEYEVPVSVLTTLNKRY